MSDATYSRWVVRSGDGYLGVRRFQYGDEPRVKTTTLQFAKLYTRKGDAVQSMNLNSSDEVVEVHVSLVLQ